jgi:Anti-sigma factor NepR
MQGIASGGLQRHMRAASVSISMRTLRPSEVESIRVSIPTESVTDPSLGSHCLKKLGERLRASYDVVNEPLPVRLTELLDRLERRERRDR